MDLLAKLNEKIETLLKNYEELQSENARLNNELNLIRETLEEKEVELLECKENMALKELELEEVLAKIESIIGK
ncbi:MAG: hypothetical protein GXO62_07445 [Epsilonproteobacteria bacterium]|nr:hypothetical protein [Campylobacterota bacterium]